MYAIVSLYTFVQGAVGACGKRGEEENDAKRERQGGERVGKGCDRGMEMWQTLSEEVNPSAEWNRNDGGIKRITAQKELKRVREDREQTALPSSPPLLPSRAATTATVLIMCCSP